MHNLKATLAVFSVALLPSCLVTDFDDLENKKEGVYVNSHDKGGLEVEDFGAALIPTTGADALTYYVVSRANPTVLHVKFDQKGDRKPSAAQVINETIPGTARLIESPTVASDFGSFSTPGLARVALGVVDNGVGKVAMLPGNFDEDNGLLAPITLVGGMEPTGIAFGNTNASTTGTDGTDMLAFSGAELNLIADYTDKIDATGNCGVLAGGKVLLANLDADASDDEVVVATGGEVFVTTGLALEGKMNPSQSCGFGVDLTTSLSVPAGASDFGAVIAAGNFNAGGLTDLVVASPETNSVYVYMDWTIAAPTAPVRITGFSAVAFGSVITVGDFDGDGIDELVIADPKTAVADNTAAGRAYIFSEDGSGGFGAPLVLHDARAESNQNFGRSLAAVPGFGSDRLVVGTKDEIFTYFRTPLSGDVDFRF